MELLKILLASLGGTFIITNSYIMKPFREWITTKSEVLGRLVTCPQCTGVYMGVICFLLVRYKIDILVYTLAASFVAFIINKKI